MHSPQDQQRGGDPLGDDGAQQCQGETNMGKQQVQREQVDKIGNGGPDAEQDRAAQGVKAVFMIYDVVCDQREGGEHGHQSCQIVAFAARKLLPVRRSAL